MLYILMSEHGHYEAGAKRVNDPIYPTIPSPFGRKYTLPNGCYNVNLSIKQIDNKDIVSLTKETDTIWLMGQEDTMSWHSKFDTSNCGLGKDVRLFRNKDTDIIVYEMPVNSWLLTGDIVYHNNSGVLVKRQAEDIVGIETWCSLVHNFIQPDALGYVVRKNANTNSPYFANSPRIYF